MTTVLMNDLLDGAERSAKWAWLRTLLSAANRHDRPYMLQRSKPLDQSVTSVTEYEREVRELADAAERESIRRMADAKALHRAGMARMKQAEALQSQADYYSHLIR